MLEGMEKLVGRKLKPEIIERNKNMLDGHGYMTTSPDFYSENMHVHMNIHVNIDYIITDFSGTKYFSVYRGLYNRSSPVYNKKFTKRDMAYFRQYVKSISD